MSRRNTREAKAARRTQKALRTPLDAYIDIVEWIKVRERCSTMMAYAVISWGAIRVGDETVQERFILANLRDQITIVDPFADGKEIASGTA